MKHQNSSPHACGLWLSIVRHSQACLSLRPTLFALRPLSSTSLVIPRKRGRFHFIPSATLAFAFSSRNRKFDITQFLKMRIPFSIVKAVFTPQWYAFSDFEFRTSIAILPPFNIRFRLFFCLWHASSLSWSDIVRWTVKSVQFIGLQKPVLSLFE